MRILTALVTVVALGGGTLAAQQPAAATTPAATTPAAAPSPAQALGLSIYPAKQQTKEQQANDERECLAWAEQQTGLKLPAAPADTGQAEKDRGIRGRRDAKEAKKAADQAAALRQQQVTTLKKPMTSCLQGREYTVN
jgi:hypothetical protein